MEVNQQNQAKFELKKQKKLDEELKVQERASKKQAKRKLQLEKREVLRKENNEGYVVQLKPEDGEAADSQEDSDQEKIKPKKAKKVVAPVEDEYVSSSESEEFKNPNR